MWNVYVVVPPRVDSLSANVQVPVPLRTVLTCCRRQSMQCGRTRLVLTLTSVVCCYTTVTLKPSVTTRPHHSTVSVGGASLATVSLPATARESQLANQWLCHLKS